MPISRQGLCVLLAVLGWLSAAMVSAQSPLSTLTGGGNSGNVVGGGIYFDLQVNSSVAITQIDALCSGSTVAGQGQLEVWACPITYVGNLTNAANWTLLGSATAPVGPGAMTSFVLAAPIALPVGVTFGVGLRALGFGHGYTNGNGANQTFSNAELTLQAGAAQNTFLSGAISTPRVFNGSIFYQGGGPPADDDCAGASVLGSGRNGPFTNVGYTSSVPPMPCGPGGLDRWFRFTAPATGEYAFHSCQAYPTAPLDTVFELFAGSCGALVSLGCNDDTCALGSRVTTTLASQESVYLRVGGWSLQTGNFYVTVDTLQAGFTASPLTGAAPLQVQFTDASTSAGLPPSSWSWDLDGNGTVDSTAQNPSFTYAPGTYSVSLTVGNGVNTPVTLTRTSYITVVPDLVANFTASPTSGLAPLSVQFTDTSTSISGPVTSWAWDFDGNGTTDSTLRNPVFVYGAGSYTVRLTVGNGVAAPVTLVRSGYITANAVQANFTASTVLGPAPLQVQLTDTSATNGPPINSWAWYLDNHTVPDSTAQHPTFTLAAGNHTVRLDVGNGIGTATLTRTNYIRAASLTANFTGSPLLGPAPRNVSFSDSSTSIGASITSWEWDFDDNGTIDSTQRNPSHTYTVAGSYSVRLTVRNGVNPPQTLVRPNYVTATSLVANFTASPLSGTAPLAVQFTDSSVSVGVPITGWSWDVDANGSIESTAQNPLLVIGPGTHSVRLTVDNGMNPPASQTRTNYITAAMGPNVVVFNELVYDASSSTQRFVEIYNRTASLVDISGWDIAAVVANGGGTTTTVVATIGSSTSIAPNGIFLFGSGGGANRPLSPLPLGATTLQLRNGSAQVMDQLSYEAAAGVLPGTLYQGHPLFGAHIYDSQFPTSWSRGSDGYTTKTNQGPVSDNGLEWRIHTRTRGTTNNVPDRRNELALSYESDVASWRGCQVQPALSNLAPSPAGGRHVDFAAPSPGSGRSYYFETAAADNFQLDTYVYLQLPNLPIGGLCAWSIGLCGTTDSLYEFPDPWREGRPDLNGDTGITWTYEVSRPTAGSGTVARLTLVDNGAGGTDHVILWSQAITAEQWLRLGLGVAPGSLNFRVGGNVGDPDPDSERSHGPAHGGVYVGIRQSHNVGFGVGLDESILNSSWNNRDTTGPGCDGNCPPRNSDAKTLNVATPPTQATTYAIYVPNTNNTPFSAGAISFYMAPFKSEPAPSASIALRLPALVNGNATTFPGVTVAQGQLTGNGLGWWRAPLTWNVNPPQITGTFFLELTLSSSMQPPIAAERAGEEPLEEVFYRLQQPGGTYGGFGPPTAFAWKWDCQSFPDIIADARSNSNLDSATVDFSVTVLPAVPAPPLAIMGLSFTTALLPLDGFGAPTCKAFLDPASWNLYVALPGNPGEFAQSFLIPNPLPFLGLDLHTQWAVLESSYNALGLLTSNRRTVTIR